MTEKGSFLLAGVYAGRGVSVTNSFNNERLRRIYLLDDGIHQHDGKDSMRLLFPFSIALASPLLFLYLYHSIGRLLGR